MGLGVWGSQGFAVYEFGVWGSQGFAVYEFGGNSWGFGA